MVKQFLALFLLLSMAGLLKAQDMPPLPPLPDQPGATTNNTQTLPPLSSEPNQPAASSSALPPLPNDPNSAPAPAGGLPPLPADPNAAPASAAPAGGLPPLPNDPNAAPASSSAAPPPLPGQATAPATSQAAPPLPGEASPAASTETTTEATTEAKPVKKHVAESRPWERTKWRPNAIFGGWVRAKGGNESSRMSWATQEVLNSLAFKGYKVIKEEGKYHGQTGAPGHQWRTITFSVPKSKLTLEVHLQSVGKKVWVRVGPGEPPPFSVQSIPQVKKVRAANLKALHLVRKKFGRRITAHRIIHSWEAPYSYARATADE